MTVDPTHPDDVLNHPDEPATHQDRPADPPELDLDAWLDGVSVPEATITIYGAAKLVARHEQLQAQLAHQQRLDEAVRPEDRTQDHGLVASEIARQIDANREEMSKSALTLRIRGLTADENDVLGAEFTTVDERKATLETDWNGLLVAQLATAIIDPVFSREQVTKLQHRVSSGEFNRITKLVKELTQGYTELPF